MKLGKHGQRQKREATEESRWVGGNRASPGWGGERILRGESQGEKGVLQRTEA